MIYIYRQIDIDTQIDRYTGRQKDTAATFFVLALNITSSMIVLVFLFILFIMKEFIVYRRNFTLLNHICKGTDSLCTLYDRETKLYKFITTRDYILYSTCRYIHINRKEILQATQQIIYFAAFEDLQNQHELKKKCS